MAIKENIKALKEGISTEEQFLESMIKGERFIKKYKIALIVLMIAFVVGAVGYYIDSILNESKIAKTNEIYDQLLAGSGDKNALKTLEKEAPSLYVLLKFKQLQDTNDTAAITALANSTNIEPVLKQIILASAGNAQSEILANYNALVKGYELLKQDKIQEANAEFAKIPQNSQLMGIVKNLQHYQGNAK